MNIQLGDKIEIILNDGKSLVARVTELWNRKGLGHGFNFHVDSLNLFGKCDALTGACTFTAMRGAYILLKDEAHPRNEDALEIQNVRENDDSLQELVDIFGAWANSLTSEQIKELTQSIYKMVGVSK